jgi:hypothetical protein
MQSKGNDDLVSVRLSPNERPHRGLKKEKANGSKDLADYNSAMEAAQQAKEATQRLSQALAEL